MTLKKAALLFLFSVLTFSACKQEIKKEIKKEKVTLAISGMTCEIGCAKTIQSKLSKKEGVLEAKVIFNDSSATINYDANTTSKKDLIAFVDGIAGGELYKASESKETISKEKKHSCTEDCKEKCEEKAKKMGCCSGEMKDGKMSCTKDCKMSCCTDKKS